MIIIYGFIVFIIGLMFGSFYACMGYRIPNKISLIKPGSFFFFFKKPLKWYMNIPIISYIVLKGKCAYCDSKIDITSFIVELFTGISFLGIYLCYGFSYEFIILIILISALSVTSVSDFKYYYISDRVIFISTILILATNIYFLKFSDYKDNLIAMVVMFILLLLIKLVGDKVFKRESLGGGDIKLMLLVGASLGLLNSFIALFISSIIALISSIILNDKENEGIIPFGPFIIFGTIIVFILSQDNFLF